MKSLREWMVSAYVRELPRILRDQRWPFFLVVSVFVAGCISGFRSAQTADFGQMAGFFERATSTQWHDWLFPFPRCHLWERGCLGFFVPNTVRAVLVFFWGTISFGLLPLWIVWFNGSYVGWVVGGLAPMARQASGVGVAGTAAGGLLPHGLLEYPAFLLAWALALRAGLAWIRPLPHVRRWPSVKRLFRDFRISLLAIVPLLLLAALLETYANPFFVDRYIVGIGKAPAMIAERRVGRHFSVDQSALSPDGDDIVAVDLGGRVWLRELSADKPAVLLADPGDDSSFVSPSWSPDGDRIGLIRSPVDFDNVRDYRLVILDLPSGRVNTVPRGPVGRYLRAAWDPDADLIACIVLEFSADLLHTMGTNIWEVDLRAGTWHKITSFEPGRGVAPGGGLSWSPDGRDIVLLKSVPHQEQRDAQTSTKRGYTLFIMSSDGANLREVTSLRHTTDVAWSPDGNWIAFSDLASDLATQIRPGSEWWEGPNILDIGLVQPDGSDRIDGLARIDAFSSLSWSSDGQQLAYQRLATCIIGTPRVLASQ